MMKMIKSILITLTMLALSITGFAQKTDSTSIVGKDSVNFPKRVVTAIADRFAVARPLNFEFAHAMPYNYSVKVGDDKIPGNKVTKFDQMKFSANVNFVKRKNWILGATLGYRGTSVEMEAVQGGTAETNILKDDFHYFFSAVNLTYFSTLFKKRTFYSATLLGDGSEKHFERVKGIFTATMLLKASQKTKITVGMLLNVDPGAQTPFVPTFSYEHKFDNGLIADIVMPRSMYLRKFVFNNNGRVSLGMEFDQTILYLYNLGPANQKYEYRQIDINPGVVYDHAIGKYFLFTAKSGIRLTPDGRVFRKEDSFADPVYQISPRPTFYFNIGVSFNPFSVFGKK